MQCPVGTCCSLPFKLVPRVNVCDRADSIDGARYTAEGEDDKDEDEDEDTWQTNIAGAAAFAAQLASCAGGGRSVQGTTPQRQRAQPAAAKFLNCGEDVCTAHEHAALARCRWELERWERGLPMFTSTYEQIVDQHHEEAGSISGRGAVKVSLNMAGGAPRERTASPTLARQPMLRCCFNAGFQPA